jgi:carbon storage regulator CsrA
MLVLTRKTGQQVVLPKQGITIQVISVSKSRVSLGVSAPPSVAVRRSELGAALDASADRENSPQPSSANDDTAGNPELEDDLSRLIAEKTRGRVHGLSVERHDGRIVVSGRARSYYVRHLAQTAVNELLTRFDGRIPVPVDCRIIIEHVYWRSSGPVKRLADLRKSHL